MIKIFKVIFLTLCLPLFSMEPFYWKYVDKISRDQDNYFKQVYNLSPSMTGGGGVDCVTEIIRGYAAPYPSEIKQARVILLNIVNRFAKGINSCAPLKPHLEMYPLPIQRFKISVDFVERYDPKGYLGKQLSYVRISNGNIFYSYDTHTDDGYKNLHKETFAEASAIVAAEREGQPLPSSP